MFQPMPKQQSTGVIVPPVHEQLLSNICPWVCYNPKPAATRGHDLGKCFLLKLWLWPRLNAISYLCSTSDGKSNMIHWQKDVRIQKANVDFRSYVKICSNDIGGRIKVDNKPSKKLCFQPSPIEVNWMAAPCSSPKIWVSAPVQTYLRRRSGTGAYRASPLAIVAAPYLLAPAGPILALP